ncbi:MAG: hypothetical protein WCJ29_01935 [bacterium]
MKDVEVEDFERKHFERVQKMLPLMCVLGISTVLACWIGGAFFPEEFVIPVKAMTALPLIGVYVFLMHVTKKLAPVRTK